jgi:hypothetical protein
MDRTFTSDKSFVDNESIHTKMRRILVAYWKRNSSVGYCQGMNCLIGMILKVVKDEEDAFWLFASLIETVLPLDYYSLMLQVLVDQKVLMKLIKDRKPKFLKNYHDIEVELVMKSYQWFICLYSLNFPPHISKIVWDFLFLEGDIALFKWAFALMEYHNEEPTWGMVIRKYFKYSDIKYKKITNLRKLYRKWTINEQREIYTPTNNSFLDEQKNAMFTKVKFLNKFIILNQAFCNASDTSQVGREQMKFDNFIRCSTSSPLWLYDFTNRCKILHYLIFKVGKPWKIIHDYFGEEDDRRLTGGMENLKAIFSPVSNIEVTPEDNTVTFIRKLRKSTICLQGAWEVESDDEENDNMSEDQILMVRDMHLCAFKGFEQEFQQLFNDDSSLLFHNATIFYNFLNEKSWIELSESLVYEILSYKQFKQAIKSAKAHGMKTVEKYKMSQDMKEESDIEIKFVDEGKENCQAFKLLKDSNKEMRDSGNLEVRRNLINWWKFR